MKHSERSYKIQIYYTIISLYHNLIGLYEIVTEKTENVTQSNRMFVYKVGGGGI